MVNILEEPAASIFTSVLRMEAVCPLEMLVTTYQVTHCRNTEDHNHSDLHSIKTSSKMYTNI